MREPDDRSKALRLRLAAVGINLPDPVADREVKPANVPPPPPELDRAKIRAILISRGAPERDLDWLAQSCPSERKAWGYRPPRFM